jgi:hypothetical protein
VAPLIEVTQNDRDWFTRKYAARSLGYMHDPRGDKALADILASGDLKEIANVYEGIIASGGAGSIPNWRLIAALDRHGYVEMAQYFLDSQNGYLTAAAKQWASKHGVIIREIYR